MEESEHNFRTADIWRRPHTQELVDVHVYLVPSEDWIEPRKLAKRDIIDHAVSSGFVRVLPSTTLLELRNDINEQLGAENVPETFVFLRSVGRNFTQVKPKQELDLKVKSFIPPCAEEPEVYVKEGSYTLLRSSSLGPEVALSREPSSRVQNSSFSVDSSADFPTSSESARPSLTESNLTDTPAEEEEIKRTQSLDRRGSRSPTMASRRAPILHQRQQRVVAQRRSYMPRNIRPPTPRVMETPLNDVPHSRSKSIASVKPEEVIRESPTEQIEENETSNQNLAVDDEETRIVINSPPPRPSTASNAEKEVQIPVPTPTPTPVNKVRSLKSMYEDIKAERRLKELKRDALLHKVKDLQRRKASSKDQAREEWRRRYLEVKKLTPRLEDHCSKLRQELEKLVKDMLVSVKTDPDSKPHKPSKKTSYKIMIMRLLQEVEDLRRRLQSVAVKLNAETKLRAQAEFEVKKLRQDLLHKKTQVTLTRKQASFPQTTELFFISAV